jgi:hypothetical protein
MTGFCNKAASCDALAGLGLTGLRTTGLGRTIVTPTLALTGSGSGVSCHAPQVLIAPSSSRWSNSDPNTPPTKARTGGGKGKLLERLNRVHEGWPTEILPNLRRSGAIFISGLDIFMEEL